MRDATTGEETKVTVGLDLGDRHIQVCVVDEAGEVIEEARLATRPQALRRRFCGADQLRIVLEAGTHSPWVSRLLAELGHEVIVANPRKLRLIYANDSKSDRVDAEYLARVGRLDPALLAPLRLKGTETPVALTPRAHTRVSAHQARLCVVLTRSRWPRRILFPWCLARAAQVHDGAAWHCSGRHTQQVPSPGVCDHR